ncbi:UNVERIFIED_CONTAM: hypothetical protein HDU68_002280 [Siphonaria sp. JEL0065]|nr:hypothetical protein HDU68_002280 [Siphonaria sp. JEL0065]
MSSKFEEFSELVRTRQPTATQRPAIIGRPVQMCDVFQTEAYKLSDQLQHLQSLLGRIRPLFLDAHRHLKGRAIQAVFSANDAELAGFELATLSTLSDNQRAALNARVKLLLEAAVVRVRALENAAKTTASIKAPEHKQENSFLSSLLSTVNNANADAHTRHLKVLSEHRTSIVWLLQKRLVDSSDAFRRLQEQWLEIQTRRDDGYLNIPKKRDNPPVASLSFDSKSLSSASDPSNILYGLSATVGRAANLATSMANTQLKSIVTAAQSTAKQQQQQQPDDPADGWELDDDFNAFHANDAENVNEPSVPGAFVENNKKHVLNPIETGTGLRQRGNVSTSKGNDIGPPSSYQPILSNEEKEAQEFFANMSADKRMLLERENEDLLEHFESGLDQIRTATQTIQEITSLQSQMAYHLQAQEKAIESLHEDAWQATEHIEAANVYLNNSKKLFAESRIWLLVFFLVASFALLFLDWYYS